MPASFGAATSSGTTYTCPTVGEPGPTLQVNVDMSALTAGSTGEVDAYGFLKPGVVFDISSGLLIPVASGQPCYGYVQHPIQLIVGGSDTGVVTDTTLDAATDQPITVCISGAINRDIGEDNMGRAYTADEIAGFNLAASLLRLTET